VRDDDGLWAWEIIHQARHLDCGGWGYDVLTDRLVCICGTRLYQTAQELVT
jgi:hypothetical protein